jgi:carbon-monoxide dehydrogenase large subunit
MQGSASGEGIGRSDPRLEDDRYLRGKGEFIADIRLAGMRDLAFVRSPVAHARIRAIRKPRGAEAAVFVAQDLIGVQPIVAVSGLPGFKPPAQPVLATGKVRVVARRSRSASHRTAPGGRPGAGAVDVEF